MLYVDYVRYFEADSQQPVSRWQAPLDPSNLPYYPRTSVRLAVALGCLEMTTPTGLAVISDVWRPWKPDPATTRSELREKIRETIVALQKTGIVTENMEQETKVVIESWPFPMWDTEMKEIQKDIHQLRKIQIARKHPDD